MERGQEGEEYLREGDWITISFHGYSLYGQGLQSAELGLKQFGQASPIPSVFIVQAAHRQGGGLVHFGQKVVLLHLLSGKYLSYALHSSQEEVRLKYARTANCLFAIKPIFKCQGGFSRRIRRGEQVCLESGEGLRLCIELAARSQGEAACFVSMRKHEESILLVDRVNLTRRGDDELTNLLVCQLSHLETGTTLYGRTLPPALHFSHDINQYDSFLTLEPSQYAPPIRETTVSYGSSYNLRFFTSGYYLGFEQGKPCLSQQPNSFCEFVFQPYDDRTLKELSVIKLKHVESGMSVGVERGQLRVGAFRLGDTFQLRRVDYGTLKVTLLVNELHASLQKLLAQRPLLPHRLPLQQALKEMLRFSFPPNCTTEHFLRLQPLRVKLTAGEQKLLAEVGFISLIAGAVRELGEMGAGSEGGFYRQAMAQLMMVLTSICLRNRQNVQQLTPYLPGLYELLGVGAGVPQALFFLFQDPDSLQLLERTEHKGRRGRIRSIELLLEHIEKGRSWDPEQRTHLLQLLECLIQPPNGEKMLLHEFSLRRAIGRGRLRNILMPMVAVGEEIELQLADGGEELGDVLSKRSRFGREGEAIRAQLRFYCAVYGHPSSRVADEFRNLLGEDVLLNYIKSNLGAQDICIFLRILQDVYLHAVSVPTQSLIFLSEVPQRSQEYDSRMLDKLKSAVASRISKSLSNELIDSATPLCVELMVRFSKLGLVEKAEWGQLLRLAQEYLEKNCEKIGVEGELKPLGLAIVKLMQYAEQVEVGRLAGRLVERLREEGGRVGRVMERIKEEVGGRLGLQVSHKAEEVVKKVLKEGQLLDQQHYVYLLKLIEHALQKDIEIFQSACLLLAQLNTRPYRIVQQLKSVVLIEGEWSLELVRELQDLHGEVEELAGEYRRKEGEEERVGLSLSLAQKIKQVNEVFYRWDSSSPRHSVSPFVQNLMRETGFFQTVISFVKEQQRELRTARSRVFAEVFNFLLLFLYRNHSNLSLSIAHFRVLRWLYTYDDHGQAKLLFLLAANPTSRLALAPQLTQAALQALTSRTPNPYAVLSILSLMQGEGKVNLQVVQEVGAGMVKMGVKAVWKVGDNGWEWQADTQQKENYCENTGYYLFLIMRLFLLLAECCSLAEVLAEELRREVKVDLLLGLLLGKDLLEECNLTGMGLLMMKEETMQVYRRFYEPYPRENTLLVFCNQFLTRLLNFKLQEGVVLPDLAGSPDHVHALHAECLKVKHNQQLPAFPPTLHLIIVTIFYPFLLALTKVLPASQRSQAESILGQAGRRLKQLLTKLSRTDYHRHIKDYNLAVIACEEVLKYKLGYDLQQAKDDSDKQLPQQFQSRLYRIEVLHNLVDNCMVLAESRMKSQAVGIYKSILVIMHSPKIRQLLEAAQKVAKPLQQVGALEKLASGLERGLEQGLLKGESCLQLFWMLAVDHPHLMDFILHYDGTAFKKLQSLVVKAPDPSHRLLGKYLTISNQLLTNLINSPHLLKPNIFQDDPVHRQQILHLRAALYGKLREVMAAERVLYDQRALGRQMQQFEEQCRLNCDAVGRYTHSEQTLLFLGNKFLIAGHGSKQILMPLLPDVLLLLRSYLRFVNLFQKPYLPRELHHKVQLCLRVLFYSLTPANPQAIALLSEGNYHQEFNRLLQLDDCWETARAEVGRTVRERLMEMRGQEKQGWQREWLTTVIEICEKSQAFYGEEIAYDWAGFPLQPISSLFGPLKRSLMLILNQLKMSSLPAADEILLNLNSSLIHQNVAWIYRKHHNLFKNFHLSTLAPCLDYPPSHPLHAIADTLCFENGLDLTALTLYLGTLRKDNQLQLNYAKYWQGVHSFRGLINRLGQFMSDLGGLCCGTDRAQPQDRMSKIYEFFYSKMGRVQILAGGKVVQLDFLIRPQCSIHQQDRQNFMGELNFVSTQLKLQSIARSALRFHLLFDEYCKFQTRFRKARGLLFMDEYLIIIKLANLVLVYLDNFYLLLNSGRDQQDYYSRFKISDPFQIFLLLNFTITLLYFLLFSFKNVPILAAQFRQEQEWSSSTRYQQYSPWRRRLLLAKKVMLNSQFIYSLVYLLVMALVFVNKVVVAVLVLDLFIQIPQMRTLLLALWRAKVQIVLAFISFLLIHYFYAILTYFIFESHVQKFCGSLGECFGYIFNLVYRQVGGFPGYFYEKRMLAGGSSQFDIYVVFMDVYLILTFQIFSAVIIVIIIDAFSKISRRNAQRKETLSLNCLVCGLSRTVFNTSSTLNFKTHVAVHHNVWNYLYYYHYLQNKRQMERNAHEWGILLQTAPDWLPNDCAKGFKEPVSV